MLLPTIHVYPFDAAFPPFLTPILSSLLDESYSSPFPLYWAELEVIYLSYPASFWHARLMNWEEKVRWLKRAREDWEDCEGKLERTKRWRFKRLRRLRREIKVLEERYFVCEAALERAEEGAFTLLTLREEYLDHKIQRGSAKADNPTVREIAYHLKDLSPLPAPLTDEQVHLLKDCGIDLSPPPPSPFSSRFSSPSSTSRSLSSSHRPCTPTRSSTFSSVRTTSSTGSGSSASTTISSGFAQLKREVSRELLGQS